MKRHHSLISTFVFVCVTVIFCRCGDADERIAENISIAGANASELENVLEYFADHEQKHAAAEFLIANMASKYSRKGDYSSYNTVYPFIDSLTLQDFNQKQVDARTSEYLKTLQNKYGPIGAVPVTVKPDLEAVSAHYLIDNINDAYESWQSYPWSKNVPFAQFCEYILPHRVHDEPLSEFRSFFRDAFSWVKDSLHDQTDLVQACLLVNNYIADNFAFVSSLDGLPFPTAKEMFQFSAGECHHRYFLAVSIMRSLGMPVAIDQSMQWNHWAGKHSWVVLITGDSIVPFNAGEHYDQFPEGTKIPIGLETSSTVFRNMFSEQLRCPSLVEDNLYYVPDNFRTPCLQNVSHQYQYPQISVTLDVDTAAYDQIIYLGCFGYGEELIAVDYLMPGQSSFKAIGKCGIYVPFHFKNNKKTVLSYPFIVSCEGAEKWYSNPLFDQMDTITLKRKYGMQDSMLVFSQDMVGGKFWLSNDADFSNHKEIHAIANAPEAYERVQVECSEAYRFVRYVAPEGKRTNIAEISVENENGRIDGTTFGAGNSAALYDADIRTNYSASAQEWAGIDLGRPERITRLRYLPRNNFNIIEPGDIYELLYFDGTWETLGIQKATENQLTFAAPRYALLLLKNLTKGKEERIFKYENGSQIFW